MIPTFNELMQNEKVRNHPLLAGYNNLPNVREGILKHSQSLEDEFSQSTNPLKEDPELDLQSTIHEAARLVEDSLAQFDFPLLPKISYNNTRDLKYARHNEAQVSQGLVLFNVEMKAASGIKKTALIPVAISGGTLVPPSVMEVDGSMYTLSQSSVNTILGRLTSYELPQLREQFDPPMNRDERSIAVDMRNEAGWKTRTKNPEHYMMQEVKQARRRAQMGLESYLSVVEDWAADQGLSIEGTPSFAEGEMGLSLSDGSKIVVTKGDEAGSEVLWVSDLTNPNNDDTITLTARNKNAAGKKAVKSTPSAYGIVMEAMIEAEESGEDTFPRPYHYVLANYILKHVNTASKDAWEPHLINQGFCINPYGYNRHRFHKGGRVSQSEIEEYYEDGGPNKKQCKGCGKLFDVRELDDKGNCEDCAPSAKNAKYRRSAQHEKTQEFDKEIDFELDEDEGISEAVPGGNSRFYTDTKTPIEPSDKVRFPHSKGPMRGVIVEISEDENTIIIESKGDQYRVEVDSVEPLPATFKKMYR